MSEYHREVSAPAEAPAIGFLFIGGTHHMLHLAPVAAALAQRGDVRVHLFARSEEDRERLDGLLRQFGKPLPIEVLPTPSWARMLPRLRRGWSALKLPRLCAGRRRLAAMDVLVTAERTSTMLKRLPGPCPKLVHIPHGAGDRAKGFESRLRLFDHVIVAGPKDRARMIAEGLVEASACSVSGYVKLAAVLAARRNAKAGTSLFQNDRRTVLYNPHFAPDLGSWHRFGPALVRTVVERTDYNLIIAPHVRLRERLSPEQRQAIEDLAVPGRVLVDLGSDRSCDMTYTLAADTYVGDVSSQVYEFLHQPRPCLFLNAGERSWQSDSNFAFWHLGEVAVEGDDLLSALHAAEARHPDYRERQTSAVRQAFGPAGGDAVTEAARIVADLAWERRARRAAA